MPRDKVACSSALRMKPSGNSSPSSCNGSSSAFWESVSPEAGMTPSIASLKPPSLSTGRSFICTSGPASCAAGSKSCGFVGSVGSGVSSVFSTGPPPSISSISFWSSSSRSSKLSPPPSGSGVCARAGKARQNTIRPNASTVPINLCTTISLRITAMADWVPLSGFPNNIY